MKLLVANYGLIDLLGQNILDLFTDGCGVFSATVFLVLFILFLLAFNPIFQQNHIETFIVSSCVGAYSIPNKE